MKIRAIVPVAEQITATEARPLVIEAMERAAGGAGRTVAWETLTARRTYGQIKRADWTGWAYVAEAETTA